MSTYPDQRKRSWNSALSHDRRRSAGNDRGLRRHRTIQHGVGRHQPRRRRHADHSAVDRPGYDYDFVVTNNSMGIMTSVAEIDWDNTLEQRHVLWTRQPRISALILRSSTGPTTRNPTPLINTFRVSGSVGYKDFIYDDINDGIKEGQQQVFSFMSDVLSVTDLGNMLGTDGYGVAIKMQGLTEDEQAAGWGEADQREEELLLVQANSFVQLIEPVDNDGGSKESNVVSAPSPTAALAGVALAGIAGLRRRRK